jgi:hypothetical protein
VPARGLLSLGLGIAVALGVWLALRAVQRSDALGAAPPAERAPVVAPVPAREGTLAPARLAPAASAEIAPAPPADRVAAAAEVALELVAAGAPLADARWVAFRGEEVLASGTTAADGLARVALAGGGAFELAASAPGVPPQRRAVAAAPPRQTLVLDGGAAVAGRVTIDGAPPAEPLVLRLHARPRFPVPEGLPPAARDALLRPARYVSTVRSATGDGGAFRFPGLEAGFRGQLSWSDAYRLARDADAAAPPIQRAQIDLDAPREGIVLALHTAPVLTGRVVTPAGGPVARGEVTVAWTFGPASRATTSVTAGEDGAFAVRFDDALPAQVEVEVDGGDLAGRAGRARHALAPPEGASRWHAGDLAVRATRALAVFVVDAGGAPVADAEVTELHRGVQDRQRARTDADGRAALRVDAGPAEVRVASAAHEPVELVVRPGYPRIDVMLARGTVLVVELAGGADRAGSTGVAVRADEPPFPGADGGASWIPAVVPGGASWTVGDGEAAFFGRADDRYVFRVRPGVALRVAAAAKHGGRFGERDLAPLAPGEERVVRIDADVERRTLAGRVVDPDGAPVRDASVRVGAAGGSSLGGGGVDEDGGFRFEVLATERVRVRVLASGFAPLEIAELAVTDAPVELVLDRGRDVLVRVADAGGRAVLGADVSGGASGLSFRPPSHGESPAALPDGVYRLAHAPREAFDAVVRIAGRTFPETVPAGAQEVRVEVPAWTRCTVALRGRVDLLAHGGAQLVLRSEDPPCWNAVPIADAAEDVAVERVFPGRYELFVQRHLRGPREMLSEPTEVEVTADGAVRLAVTLREP